jgi:branched-chain amino acid transport system permease protein
MSVLNLSEPDGSGSADEADGRTLAQIEPPARSRSKLTGIALVIVVFAIFPAVVTNPVATGIGFWALLFMTAATCWGGFAGSSGYVSLGYAAFYGTGAYALALMVRAMNMAGSYWEFALTPLAGLISMIVALPYGLVALRTRRHQFVILTVAIFFVFQLVAFNVNWLGGSYGIYLPIAPWIGDSFNDHFYYAALILVILTVALYAWMRRTRFGLQLNAIRDDEDRAISLGVNTGRVKLVAWVISAGPIGMAGAVYAYFIGQVLPQFAFDPLFDASVAVMCIAGGLGTIAGPLLGALVLESLQQYLTLQFSSTTLYLVLYGVVFVLVILFLPQGIYPLIEQRLHPRRLRGGLHPVIAALRSARERIPAAGGK